MLLTMTRYLSLVFCLLLAATLVAQPARPDVIFQTDGNTIEAIVVEVAADHVQYRKFSSPQGAIYKLATAQVQRIEYPNGVVDDFQAPLEADRPLPFIERAAEPVSYQFTTTRSPDAAEGAPPPPAETEKRSRRRYRNAEEASFGGEGSLGTRRYVRNRGVPVELPARTVTGLEFSRIPMDSLLLDERSADQYEGVYEWQGSDFASPNARVAWKMEWDNVELTPKVWTGYSWRSPPRGHKKVRLKGNELMLGGVKAGEFVMLENNGKVARGFLYTSDKGRELFLWKVE